MNGNVFIINGHQAWDVSPGQLNRTMVDTARDVLTSKGYAVRDTHIDADWDVEEQIDNMIWADLILFQFPVYWFGVPWGLKKFIDEVYMHGRSKIFLNDGRTRSDTSRKYGSGGLLQGRRYMLSTTWNAPKKALDDPGQLFEQRGVDGVFLWFHKANEFCGLEAMPSFACHDVVKNPNFENDLKRWNAHLKAHF